MCKVMGWCICGFICDSTYIRIPSPPCAFHTIGDAQILWSCKVVFINAYGGFWIESGVTFAPSCISQTWKKGFCMDPERLLSQTHRRRSCLLPYSGGRCRCPADDCNISPCRPGSCNDAWWPARQTCAYTRPDQRWKSPGRSVGGFRLTMQGSLLECSLTSDTCICCHIGHRA